MDVFEQVYRRHYQDVFRFALFLTGDPTLAEDLASDTFVRAWTARARIRQPTVKAYLLTITRNLYRDHLRSKRPEAVELDERAESGLPAPLRLEHRSELRSIRARLRRVAPGDRRALLLYVVREMSYAEIASRLGVNVGSVKSRIARAREVLRLPDAARKREEPS